MEGDKLGADTSEADGSSVSGDLSVGRAPGNPKQHFSLSTGDDSGSRRSAAADRDSNAGESDGAAADSFSPDAVWRARKGSGDDAEQLHRAGKGRLHFCDSELARAVQIRRRFQAIVVCGFERSEGHERDD